MDCVTCPFHREGDLRSLDYAPMDEDGNEKSRKMQLPASGPLLDEIIADTAEMEALFARLSELMPEALKIGELRMNGLADRAIEKQLGIGRKTFAYRLGKLKAVLEKEFPELF